MTSAPKDRCFLPWGKGRLKLHPKNGRGGQRGASPYKRETKNIKQMKIFLRAAAGPGTCLFNMAFNCDFKNAIGKQWKFYLRTYHTTHHIKDGPHIFLWQVLNLRFLNPVCNWSGYQIRSYNTSYQFEIDQKISSQHLKIDQEQHTRPPTGKLSTPRAKEEIRPIFECWQCDGNGNSCLCHPNIHPMQMAGCLCNGNWPDHNIGQMATNIFFWTSAHAVV